MSADEDGPVRYEHPDDAMLIDGRRWSWGASAGPDPGTLPFGDDVFNLWEFGGLKAFEAVTR